MLKSEKIATLKKHAKGQITDPDDDWVGCIRHPTEYCKDGRKVSCSWCDLCGQCGRVTCFYRVYDHICEECEEELYKGDPDHKWLDRP